MQYLVQVFADRGLDSKMHAQVFVFFVSSKKKGFDLRNQSKGGILTN